MGKHKEGIQEGKDKGREIGKEAIDAGEKIKKESQEVKSIIDSVQVLDEDEEKVKTDTIDGYHIETVKAVEDSVEPGVDQAGEILEGVAADAQEGRDCAEDAEGKYEEAQNVSDIGKSNASSAADRMRQSVEEYEADISEAESISEELRQEADTIKGDVDSIWD